MGTRSASRLSATARNIAWATASRRVRRALWWPHGRSVHAGSGARRRQQHLFVLRRLPTGGVGIFSLVLGGVSEYRDAARFGIQLEHGQQLESLESLDLRAQNDKIRDHLLDL